jgi:tripartite tricarboxylate transporter TctB family protein
VAAQTPERKPALGADFIVPLLALAFAAYFFVSIAGLAWEAKANGVLIGAILVILVGIQLARLGVQVAKREGGLRFDSVLVPREALPKRIGLVLITVAFIVAMQWLGLTLALFLAMGAALYLMGLRKPLRIFWIAFAVAALAYLLFIALLESDIPHGPVERAISAVVSREAR